MHYNGSRSLKQRGLCDFLQCAFYALIAWNFDFVSILFIEFIINTRNSNKKSYSFNVKARKNMQQIDSFSDSDAICQRIILLICITQHVYNAILLSNLKRNNLRN